MSKTETGKIALGRGLDSLIPTGFVVGDVASPGEQVRNISLDKITVNPDQPRKEFDEVALDELAESVKQHGIIQPLVVTPTGTESYRIVAGERRYRAAKIAGLEKVPAIIRNHEELEELEISLVENVQRVDLSPLEQAVSIVRLRDQFSLSHKDIAAKLGKAETTISNIIRLLQLPKQAVEALQKNRISEGHARAILALKSNEELQTELLNKIITQKLSVRAAEEFVKNNRLTNTGARSAIPPMLSKKIETLGKRVGASIKIVPKKRGGSLQVQYRTNQELESIIRQLEN